MDEHLETSWCPRCDRLIEPERITVQLDELNRAINILDQPSHPTVPTAVGSPAVTRTRLAPGLVRGTGRVQPNGALVTCDKTNTKSDQPPPVPPPSPVIQRKQTVTASAPRRTRTIISQKQTPLYCSDKCRQRDLDNLRIQTLSRRESDSTASITSERSIFDAPAATSASSLESYDVPPKDLSRSKSPKSSSQSQTKVAVEVDHTLRWANGTTGLGAAPPKRLNNVRAPSPEPFAFLVPQVQVPHSREPSATRRGSNTSTHSQQQNAYAYSDAHTRAQSDAEERAERVAAANAYFAQHMPFHRAAERARLAEIDRVRSAVFLAPTRPSSSTSSKKRVKTKSNSAPALTSIAEDVARPSKFRGVSPTIAPEPRHPEPYVWTPPSMTEDAREAVRNMWRRDAPPRLVVWAGHGYVTDEEMRSRCEMYGIPQTFSPDTLAELDTSPKPLHQQQESAWDDPTRQTLTALTVHTHKLRQSLNNMKSDESAALTAVLALPSYERADLFAPLRPPTRECDREALALERFIGRRMVRREVSGPGVVCGVDFGYGGLERALKDKSRSGALGKGKVRAADEELELREVLCGLWTEMRKVGMKLGCDERKRAAGEA